AAGAAAPLAAADPGRHARQPADRPDAQLLAAEPRREQHDQPEQPELQIGDAGLAVDAAQQVAFVEADDEARLGAGNAHHREDAAHTVETFRDERAAGTGEQRAHQRMIALAAAAHILAAGEAGDTETVAAEQKGDRAGALRDLSGEPADPLQVDRRDDDRVAALVERHGRLRGDHVRLARRPVDEVVAQHEVPAAPRIAYI